MKPDESIEDFFDQFLYLFYEFPEVDMDWDLLKKMFEHLVHISLHGEPKTPNFFSSPNLVSHEKPLSLGEELVIPFVPYPPPFSIPMKVPSCGDNKVGKYENHMPNPSSHPPSAFHD